MPTHVYTLFDTENISYVKSPYLSPPQAVIKSSKSPQRFKQQRCVDLIIVFSRLSPWPETSLTRSCLASAFVMPLSVRLRPYPIVCLPAVQIYGVLEKPSCFIISSPTSFKIILVALSIF